MEEKPSQGTSQCLVPAVYLSPPLSTGLQGPVSQKHPWEGKGCRAQPPSAPQLLPASPYIVLHLGTGTLLSRSKASTKDAPRERRRGFAIVESEILQDFGRGILFGARSPGGNAQPASLLASLRVGSSNRASGVNEGRYFH